MARKAVIDKDLLAMALVGYKAEIARIEAAMAELKARLGSGPADSPAVNPPGKRTLSASARRRIAAAQKKRWAVIKNAKATPPAEKPKRKMSAAARKRIGDAARKRWADLRKATGKKGKKHPIAKLNGGGGAGGAGGGGSRP